MKKFSKCWFCGLATFLYSTDYDRYEKLRRNVRKKMRSGRVTLKDVVELNKAGKRWTTYNRRRNTAVVEKEINSDGLGLQNNQEKPVFTKTNRMERSQLEQLRKRAHSLTDASNKDAGQDSSASPQPQLKRRKVRQAQSRASSVQQTSDSSAIESLQPRGDSNYSASCDGVLEGNFRGMLKSQDIGSGKIPSREKANSRATNARELRGNDQQKQAAHGASKKLKAAKIAGGAIDRGRSCSNKRREPRKDSKRKRQEGNKRKQRQIPRKGKAALELFSDLVNSNPIRERQAQGSDGAELALATTGSKNRILGDLLVSLPEDVNKRQMAIDKKDILRASRSFGANKVRVVNGRWKPVGMKSGLFHHQLLGTNFMVGILRLELRTVWLTVHSLIESTKIHLLKGGFSQTRWVLVKLYRSCA